MADWLKEKLFLKNQPPKPPVVSTIPDPVPLPANSPTRAIQILQVDPIYPAAKIDRLRRTAAWIASRYGVRLDFKPLEPLRIPAWEDVHDWDVQDIAKYGATHNNHVVLLVRTITYTYQGVTKQRGGLGGGRYSVIAAVSCDTAIIHEIGHAAGLQHTGILGNVMWDRGCNADVNLEQIQAVALREWASRSAADRVRELDVPFVCS